MDALSKDIQDAIQKNLPAQVAGTLGDFIRQAEADKNALTSIRISEKVQSEKLVAAQIDRDTARAELVSLKQREAAIKDAERQLLIAQKDVEKANAVVDATRNIVAQVFANTLVKKTIYENRSVPMPNNAYAGAPPTYANDSHSLNETTEG